MRATANSHRLRVAAIVVHDQAVLLVTAKRSGSDHLVAPGGGVEAGEDLRTAVAREVREEAALEVAPGPLLAYRELVQGANRTLELYFAARLAPNQTTVLGVSGEERRVQWVPLVRLAEVPHFPERLAELCALALGEASVVVDLGVLDLPPY